MNSARQGAACRHLSLRVLQFAISTATWPQRGLPRSSSFQPPIRLGSCLTFIFNCGPDRGFGKQRTPMGGSWLGCSDARGLRFAATMGKGAACPPVDRCSLLARLPQPWHLVSAGCRQGRPPYCAPKEGPGPPLPGTTLCAASFIVRQVHLNRRVLCVWGLGGRAA